MAEWIAWALYIVGFAATATSPFDDPRLAGKPIWSSVLIGIVWPPLAVLIVAGRFWKAVRRG